MLSSRTTPQDTQENIFGITGEAQSLANTLPDLLVEARRIAANVTSGWHGRRRAGPGETFWQFRPFLSGEAAQQVDWRRSARDATCMCANGNGKRLKPSGSGPIFRRPCGSRANKLRPQNATVP